MTHGQEKNAVTKIFTFIISLPLNISKTSVIHGNKQALFIPVMIVHRKYIFFPVSEEVLSFYTNKIPL